MWGCIGRQRHVDGQIALNKLESGPQYQLMAVSAKYRKLFFLCFFFLLRLLLLLLLLVFVLLLLVKTKPLRRGSWTHLSLFVSQPTVFIETS